MNQGPLDGVKACVFDAYGTLFDFAAAARSCRDVLGEAVDKLTALWRDKQLQYTWLRAAQCRHADFWQVTGNALDFALETLDIAKPSLRERLMALYLTLEPFPEVPNVLTQLKQAGLRTAILSNGPPRMLDAAVRGAERLMALRPGPARTVARAASASTARSSYHPANRLLVRHALAGQGVMFPSWTSRHKFVVTLLVTLYDA